MRRKTLHVNLAGFAFCVIASAQSLPPNTRIEVAVETASTPDKQIQRASALITESGRTSDDRQRLTLVLTALSTLQVIPQRWPKATEWILDSYVMQSEIANAHQMPRNALDALLVAAPISEKTPRHPTIHRMLGQTYERLGDFASAEKHFLTAERSPQWHRLTPFEASGTLDAVGLFYMHQNNPRESMKRFRAESRVKGIPAIHRASALLASLKENARRGDDSDRTDMRADSEELKDAIADARRQAKNAAEMNAIASIEKDADGTKSRSGLR
jgi:tetratricopeptide (TPR) repeat protein